jgi:Cys-tRNA(Pro)/Cys-tRNA(Cys) deacylase
MKPNKTNVMRILDAHNIAYNTLSYSHQGGAIDGRTVANLIGKSPSEVFKTLVTKAGTNVVVLMIPIDKTLDLKKAALAANQKSLEMVALEQLLPLTGYVRGGCSPIGMRYKYLTLIDESASKHQTIIFSAGKIGLQVEVSLNNLNKILPFILSTLTTD